MAVLDEGRFVSRLILNSVCSHVNARWHAIKKQEIRRKEPEFGFRRVLGVLKQVFYDCLAHTHTHTHTHTQQTLVCSYFTRLLSRTWLHSVMTYSLFRACAHARTHNTNRAIQTGRCPRSVSASVLRGACVCVSVHVFMSKCLCCVYLPVGLSSKHKP